MVDGECLFLEWEGSTIEIVSADCGTSNIYVLMKFRSKPDRAIPQSSVRSAHKTF